MQAGLFPNCASMVFLASSTQLHFFNGLVSGPSSSLSGFISSLSCRGCRPSFRPPPLQASHGPWDPVALLQANFCSSLSNSFLWSFFSFVAAAHSSFCWQSFFSSSVTSSASSSQALCLWLPSYGCCTGFFSSLGPAVSNSVFLSWTAWSALLRSCLARLDCLPLLSFREGSTPAAISSWILLW